MLVLHLLRLPHTINPPLDFQLTNMHTKKTKEDKGSKSLPALVLALVLCQTSSGGIAFAQGASIDASASSLQPTGVGLEQDSLLPPEVVPLDPAAASSLVKSQEQARNFALNSSAGTMQTTANGRSSINGMQTAQDFRKAALNSLTNQSPIQGQFVPNAFMSGQGIGSLAGQGSSIANGQQANGQLGQSSWIRPGQDAPALASSTAGASQSQTLTGGVKNQPIRRDTKRGGFSNAFSALAGFGSGMMLGSMVRYPNSALGLGLFGLGASGFGIRNGFRW